MAENAGINPIAMVTELRNRHNQGDFAGGINVRNGTISDMWAEKIVQPLLVNTSEIQLATECVGMILKIGTFSFCFCCNCCLVYSREYTRNSIGLNISTMYILLILILSFLFSDDLIPVR